MVDPTNLPDTIDLVGTPHINGDVAPESPRFLVSHGATENSTIRAESEVVEDGTIVVIKKEGNRHRPIVWRVLQKEDTEGNVVFPFLENGVSPQDYQLVSTVAMQRVYEMSHGNIGKAWKQVRNILLDAETPEGSLVFPGGIAGTNTIRTRMDNLLGWAKMRRESAPRRSGCDDEEENEFIVLLDDVLIQKESAEAGAAEAKAESYGVAQRKSREAEVLRVAAMNSSAGRKRLAELMESGVKTRKKQSDNMNTPDDKNNNTPSDSSLSRSSNDGSPDFGTLASSFAQQSALKEKKMELQAAEQKLREERHHLRHQLKMKKVEAASKAKVDANRLQEAIITLMQQQQEVMMSQAEKMDKMAALLKKIANK